MTIEKGSASKGRWPLYALVISLMAVTGFEYFYRFGALILVIFLFSLYLFCRRGLHVDKYLFSVIGIYMILSFAQTLMSFNQSIFTTLLIVPSFLTYYYIGSISHRDLLSVYINVIYILALISLVFFSLTYSVKFMEFISNTVAPHFESLGRGRLALDSYEENRNIVIYNFKNYAFSYNRNSGPFWEPGMFAVFLNIAIFFHTILRRKLLSRENFAMIAALITTFSTTGYIAFAFVLVVYLLFFSQSRFKPVYLLLLIAGAFYVAELDFMKDKVVDQIQNSRHFGASRFGAVLVHLEVISEYPFTGVGDGAAQIISKYTDADSTPNGITFVMVKYGVIVGLLYYLLLFRACLNIGSYYIGDRYLGACFFILLLILAFSQDITVRHFYHFLMILGVFVLGATERRLLLYKRRYAYG